MDSPHLPEMPAALGTGFVLVTLLSALMFLKAVRWDRKAAAALAAWAIVLAVLGLGGFYLRTQGLPPRFAMVLGLPLLAIIAVFSTASGRRWIDRADPGSLTLLHVVRVPVELGLYGLFLYGAIPGLMTFEGRNLDVLSGITAPLVYWFGYRRASMRPPVLIVWNLVCLGLLANIVVNAILSAPFDLQTQAFDQPNVAILYFPYVWLAGIIVPLVLLSHLACLRCLARGK
ncbi:MAG: hypothetical protein KA791_13555 [Flavobacteriales bacterium]|nr:hypothetical protein [Flavobacteriales bacterium]